MVSGSEALIWVDLETTCLEPMQGAVLEIASIVTDLTASVEYGTSLQVIDPPADFHNPSTWDPFCALMHGNSGLISQIEYMRNTRQSVSLMEALREQTALWRSIIDYTGIPNPVMAGSSVHFDRAWLTDKAPHVVGEYFHYRNLDVSTLRTVAHAMGLGDIQVAEPKHRALDDLRQTIDEYRRFQALVRSS